MYVMTSMTGVEENGLAKKNIDAALCVTEEKESI